MNLIFTWALSAIMSWAPLEYNTQESYDEGYDRYESIAEDLIDVVYDHSEEPVFDGEYGRAKTLMLMLSIANKESGFQKFVDYGIGARSHGPGGGQWCLMQINIGSGVTKEGWSGKDLIKDRKKCFTSALHILRSSFNSCKHLKEEDKLSGYAAGKCIPKLRESKARYVPAMEYIKKEPVPEKDEKAMKGYYKFKVKREIEAIAC